MDFAKIITTNKPELVKATNCTDALLDSFGKDVLHDSEVSDLKAETRKYSRASELWDLLKQKSVTKEALIQVLKEHNQGAAILLSNLLLESVAKEPKNQFEDGRNAVPKAFPSDCKSTLHFNDDIKHDVFKKLKARLIEEMDTEPTNSVILDELGSLNVFDRLELDPIRETTRESERSRMTQLLNLIGKKSSKDILCCLEKLCSLKEMPRKSEKFRDIIEDVYPGSSLGR